MIGHEITHGFDDTGRQFDKDGNRVSWWTPETIDKFIERKTCIVNQYSNYTVSQINMKVIPVTLALLNPHPRPLQMNGNQTQGENIADNGGVKEAFYVSVAPIPAGRIFCIRAGLPISIETSTEG